MKRSSQLKLKTGPYHGYLIKDVPTAHLKKIVGTTRHIPSKYGLTEKTNPTNGPASTNLTKLTRHLIGQG